MAGTWGNYIKLTIFGESHGEAVGIVIDGLVPGLTLNEELIEKEMQRRAPGKHQWSSTRKEADAVHIQSGVYKGIVTGAPLLGIIYNRDKRSGDYSDILSKIRPGHADYSAYKKYSGFNDPRGSGHFSGRLTAALVFAGAVAKQYLNLLGVTCGAWITGIGSVVCENTYPSEISVKWLNALKNSEFPVLEEELSAGMKIEIENARMSTDSLGGTVAAAVIGVPAGLGEPFFASIESTLSSLLFSIGAVKGVEFGSGFAMAQMKGSTANDPWEIEQGRMQTKTNHNGGINGGITNGMPILLRVAVKPTPSISQPQKTVDFIEGKEVEINIKGRHDPCIVPRAVAVVEAACALAVLEHVLGYYGRQGVEAWVK